MAWTSIAQVSPSRSGAVHTATSAAIGTADSNRRVVVIMTAPTFRTLSTFSIAGTTVTPHFNYGVGAGVFAVSSLVVPTGTTANIVATMNDTDFFGARFYIYTIDDTTIDATTVQTGIDSDSSGLQATVPYTGIAGGFTLTGITWGNGGGKDDILVSRGTLDTDSGAGSCASLNGDSSGAQSFVWDWETINTTNFIAGVVCFAPAASGGDDIYADITESATASESQSSTLRHAALITEAATATDAQSNTLSAFASALEVATATESQSVTSITSSAITEAATASEAQAASYITNSDIEEVVTATEESDAEAGAFVSIEETLTATEESSTSLVSNATQDESVTASEASSVSFVTNAEISESATASESSFLNFITSLFAVESVTATDDQDAEITEPFVEAEIIESADATEVSSNQLIGTASITETTTAQDASFTSNIIAVSITEAANATDTVSVFKKLVNRVVDGSLAIRNLSSTLIKRVFSSNLTERDL